MLLLGVDVGSSSVKACVMDGATGKVLGADFYPKQEQKIDAPQTGWAEQEPEMWWDNLKICLHGLFSQDHIDAQAIGAIGISYQMHGLVLVDEAQKSLRPSIIWCDSRAVEIGNAAFQGLGEGFCLHHYLNSPGNFTASKLKWVHDHQPALYQQAHRMMLPGDFIAMKMSGEIQTTMSGLSEGILWDFSEQKVAADLLNHLGLSEDLIPPLVPNLGVQAQLSASVATKFGMKAGIPISYRAGDQPNNAFSLQVMQPGEIAATAGTSGVVYGITNQLQSDPQSRVNTFAHVNHGEQTRLGILLCINGTGILNSWLKSQVGGSLSYEEMNQKALTVPVGSEGLAILPFGNGAERVLGNRNPGSRMIGLQFNRHHQGHLFRAAQEGILFSFRYGLEIMENLGLDVQMIRAGKANMFLSPLFRRGLATLTQSPIQLYDTDGAQGAARGAGLGAGFYASSEEAFASLEVLGEIEPVAELTDAYETAYQHWRSHLLELFEESITIS